MFNRRLNLHYLRFYKLRYICLDIEVKRRDFGGYRNGYCTGKI